MSSRVQGGLRESFTSNVFARDAIHITTAAAQMAALPATFMGPRIWGAPHLGPARTFNEKKEGNERNSKILVAQENRFRS